MIGETINFVRRLIDFLHELGIMTSSPETRFPLVAKDYEILEEIGDGVYRARCILLDEIVAIKIWNLEKCTNDLVRIFIFVLCLFIFRIYHRKLIFSLLLEINSGNHKERSS